MVAMRGADIKQEMLSPAGQSVWVEAGPEGYTLVLLLQWDWIDAKMKPAPGCQFRLGMLFSDSDLLTGEPILGGNFNNGHALFSPETWGAVSLE